MSQRYSKLWISAMVAALLTLSTVPIIASGARSDSQGGARAVPKLVTPVFTFGRTGGNIMPVKVAVFPSGLVTVNGPVHGQPATHLPSAAIKGLLKLTSAEGFYSLPKRISGGFYPDTASLFITVSTSTKSKTVYLHAAHNPRFEELLAILLAVSRITF